MCQTQSVNCSAGCARFCCRMASGRCDCGHPARRPGCSGAACRGNGAVHAKERCLGKPWRVRERYLATADEIEGHETNHVGILAVTGDELEVQHPDGGVWQGLQFHERPIRRLMTGWPASRMMKLSPKATARISRKVLSGQIGLPNAPGALGVQQGRNGRGSLVAHLGSPGNPALAVWSTL